LSDPTKAFREQNPTPKGSKLARFNRLLLRHAYSKEIDTPPKPEMDWLTTRRTPAQMGAQAFLGNNRQCWGIENGTHPRLDCSAWEHRLRIHDPNAVEILGFFHRVSISLLVAWAQQQPSARDRTYPTWQADHQANRWLMIHQITRDPTSLLAQPAGPENRCSVLTNGAVADSFFTFRAHTANISVALGFPRSPRRPGPGSSTAEPRLPATKIPLPKRASFS